MSTADDPIDAEGARRLVALSHHEFVDAAADARNDARVGEANLVSVEERQHEVGPGQSARASVCRGLPRGVFRDVTARAAIDLAARVRRLAGAAT